MPRATEAGADGMVSSGEFFRAFFTTLCIEFVEVSSSIPSIGCEHCLAAEKFGDGATSMGFHKIREIHGYRMDTDYNSRGTPGSPP